MMRLLMFRFFVVLAAAAAGLCMLSAALLHDWLSMLLLGSLLSLMLSQAMRLRAGALLWGGLTLLFLCVLWDVSYCMDVLPLYAVAGVLLGAVLLRRLVSATRRAYCLRWALGLGLLGSLLMSPLLVQLYASAGASRVALLGQGAWGRVGSHENGLDIKSQYSYSLLARFIRGREVADLSGLDAFDELWMVTPTRALSADDARRLRSWVWRGGRLVIISDHTDLFGHSSAINPLLGVFGLESRKNCIIEEGYPGGRYRFAGRPWGCYLGLTANSFAGRGEPWLWQLGYSERVDYGGHSFFSDLQVSGEDEAGLFPIALTSAQGLGSVVLFGDSTLFANFALSRPTAQMLLRMVVDGGSRFSLYAVAMLAYSLLLSVLLRESRWRMLYWAMAVMMSLAMAVNLLRSDREPDFASLSLLRMRGDWELVERQGAHFTTPFAAAYSKAAAFPLWEMTQGERGRIVAGSGVVLQAEDADAERGALLWGGDLIERLGRGLSIGADDYVACVMADASSLSFWFEDGVGPFNEAALERFWEGLQGCDIVEREFHLDDGVMRDAVLIRRSGEREDICLRMHRFADGSAWCVLGDWVIGKLVDENRILIKRAWQHPSWRGTDVVIRLD